MKEEEKLKTFVSGAAYQHLKTFIIEGLRLNSDELKICKKAFADQEKPKIKTKKILAKENNDNYFSEFSKLKRKVYREFDIERNEMKYLKKYFNGNLTDMESKVVQLLKQGVSYKECAEKLFISKSTLKTYINSIFQKRCVNSLQELIVLELTGKRKGKLEKNSSDEDTTNDVLDLLNMLL